MNKAGKLLICLISLLALSACGGRGSGEASPSLPLGGDTEWRLLADGTAPIGADGLDWTRPGYDDSAWSIASGAFGAKNGELAPVGELTPDVLLPMRDGAGNSIPTYFFRASFYLASPESVEALSGELYYDDAVTVYINGEKVFEGNLPEGGFESSLSFGAAAALDGPRTGEFHVPAHMLTAGENVLAVELHQAAESSSDIYFELAALSASDNAGTLEAEGLCLFTAGDTAMTARWYGDGRDMTLKYAKSGDESYRESALSVTPETLPAGDEYRYSAAMTDLEPGTEYVYWVESGNTRTEERIFKTAKTRELSFVFLGDPQLTGDSSAKALADTLALFSGEDFILCGGDLTDSGSDVEQYRLFLETEAFSAIPVAAVIGNHEGGELYDTYFAPEGVSKNGRDFAFSYGETLFVGLDSNLAAAEHRDFLRESMGNTEWDWVIVALHHSPFSAGKHAESGDTETLRSGYSALFEECDVDLALSGHDHIYARTGLMEGETPAGAVRSPALSKREGQTLYVSAGSSTGSKYYDLAAGDDSMFAAVAEEGRPTATRILVTPDKLSLESVYADDGSALDSVTLVRAAERGYTPEGESVDRNALIKSEREYLLSTQLPNGALAMYPAREGENAVNPYFADYSAMALLASGEQEAVKRYLDWHFQHLNAADFDVNGLAYTIYDYTVTVAGGAVTGEKPSMSYDSTDSYAASFLLLLHDYYDITGDTEYIRQNYSRVAGAAQVLLKTEQNGLTLARPDYPVQYLMDNCEVYSALDAAEELLGFAIEPELSGSERTNCAALIKNLGALRTSVAEGLEGLWSEETGAYAYALQSGEMSGFDGGVFYPDSVAQLCPAIFGVIKPGSARARAIYKSFCANWNWEELEYMDSEAAAHYWGMAAYCAAVMGDEERLETYLKSYAASAAEGHEYPLFNADAAWVVLACVYGAK